MDNTILLVLVCLGMALTYRLFFLRSGDEGTVRFRERRSGFGASAPFHAVSIHPETQACGAVCSIRAQRFLSEDAPGLPLPECNQSVCRCKYEHHSDRRTGARDRRYGVLMQTEITEFWSVKNRRTAVGRRGGDPQMA